MSKSRETAARAADLPVGPRLEAVLDIAYRARRPVLLEGPTGIGKSEVVAGLARRLGIQFTVLDLSLLEPPDLVGLPVIDQGRTIYATPRVLPREGAGILMLEELNRAERYIQQPALQLLSARRLHEYELPPGWACFAAINPEAGDYQVTPLDPALRARFLNLTVRADRSSWLAWAVGNGVHPAVLALARSHDRVLDEVPPRTWTYVAQLLTALTAGERADTSLLRDLLGGFLPGAWVELLLAQRAGWDAALELDVTGLLRDYAPGSSAQQTLHRYRSSGETDRLDEVARRLEGIVRGPEAGVLAARKDLTLAAFETLLGDLPGDARESLQEAFGGNPTLATLSEVKPDDILRSYAGSTASKKVTAWMADPLRHHR
ncbi:MAG: ATPase, partial [Myxococcales bacterium]